MIGAILANLIRDLVHPPKLQVVLGDAKDIDRFTPQSKADGNAAIDNYTRRDLGSHCRQGSFDLSDCANYLRSRNLYSVFIRPEMDA